MWWKTTQSGGRCEVSLASSAAQREPLAVARRDASGVARDASGVDTGVASGERMASMLAAMRVDEKEAAAAMVEAKEALRKDGCLICKI